MRSFKNSFKNLPIQRKVGLVILLACGTALAVTAGAIFFAELASFRQEFTRDLESCGAIIAHNSTVALAAHDGPAAEEVLQALRAKPYIVCASLDLPSGVEIASYRAKQTAVLPAIPPGDGFHFVGKYLVLNQPVSVERHRMGTLHLSADYQGGSRDTLRVYGSILCCVLLVSILLTLVLSGYLQRLLAAPLLSLAAAAQVVAERKDYSVRAPKLANDEVGQLTDAFNNMLEQMQNHAAALRVANQTLKREIEERGRTEQELAYERDLLKTLLDNLPDRIYFKDLESRFVRVSKSKLASSLDMARAGYQAEANGSGVLPEYLDDEDEFARFVVGRTDFDFYPEERALQSYADEQEIIRTGEPLIGKLESAILPNGKVSWMLKTKMPWRDPEGGIIGTFGISKDITAVKEAEAQVETLHKQLMVASRQAGMAEVATGVLHNVGNVLNSVNVSITLIHESLRHSEVPSLVKVGDLLQTHMPDLGNFLTADPKGKLVPGFIVQLAQQLSQEQALLREEHDQLVQNIEHIKEIVAMQQNYASVSGVLETVSLASLVDDALRLHTAGLARHGVRVVRHYSEVPPLSLDKHKALQILVNLVHNAKYALDDAQQAERQLTVGISLNGNDRVKVTVADNGVGIPRENLTRIFSHGFTTRKGGHGFGLHSGANAAKEMGGELTAASDGPGKGATFTLELPLTQPQENP